MGAAKTAPILRLAVAGDAAALAALAGELGYPAEPSELGWRLESLPSDDEVWVAVVDGEVVGWIHCAVRRSLVVEPNVEIRGIVVGERWRHRGVGRRLMELAERLAAEHGLSAVRLRSGAQRDGAHAFYRALGYRELKTQRVFIRDLGE